MKFKVFACLLTVCVLYFIATTSPEKETSRADLKEKLQQQAKVVQELKAKVQEQAKQLEAEKTSKGTTAEEGEKASAALQEKLQQKENPMHELEEKVQAGAGHQWDDLVKRAQKAPFVMQLHISKTGGTTMRMEGAKVLGRKDCKMNLRDGGLPRAVKTATQQNCTFISMEAPIVKAPWVWEKASWPSRGHFTVTMLRNPIEQWLSVVRHTHHGIGPSHESERLQLSKSSTALLDFDSNASYIGQWSGGHDPRNMQTRWLGPTLPVAVDRISDNSVLVLINEFYDVSMCLMAIAAGNWEPYEKQCTCDKHGSDNKPPQFKEHNMIKSSTLAGGNTMRSPIDGVNHAEMTTLTGLLADDFQLYGHGIQLFLNDVAAAEEAVGKKIFCFGNDIANEEYNRWPNRPKTFDGV